MGCAQFVYTHFFARRKEVYDSNQADPRLQACGAELTWLKEVDKFVLQNALKNLNRAY